MKYVFQFGIVWDHLPRLLDGAWLTIRLSLGAFALGFAIAVLLAFLRTAGPRPVRAADRGVRRVHPQHAVPGPAVHHLLLAAGDRHPLRGGHRGAARDEPQFLGLCDGDHPLRHRGGAAQPDRSGAFAGLHPAPDFPQHHRLSRAAHRVSGAREPVHPADARLVDRRRDFGRGTDGGHQHAAVDDLPRVRVLFRRDRPCIC